ncbi:hypothetical protein C1646_769456 [Rhizophagus diaphanus]|nr:hypothetical protein C1646_769456 [Rhizophagus diaphanus] [Rhizophagus sp. MUCL 43196]
MNYNKEFYPVNIRATQKRKDREEKEYQQGKLRQSKDKNRNLDQFEQPILDKDRKQLKQHL